MTSPDIQPDRAIDLKALLNKAIASWRTLLTGTLIGGVTAIIVSFILPEKFKVEALVQTGQALGKEIESVQILAEKMRLPRFYSRKTVDECGLSAGGSSDFLGDRLAKDLAPSIARSSSFVTISFKAKSPEVARSCLTSVLSNIILNQSNLASPKIERAKEDLRIATSRLEIAKVKQKQELNQDAEKLKTLREKLKIAQLFISEFENNIKNSNNKDERLSFSAILFATLLEKKIEIKDIELEIQELEPKVNTRLTGREDEIFTLEKLTDELNKNLAPPATEPARFAAPIYSPNFRAEPNRVAIILGGSIGAFLLSLAIVLLPSLLSERRLT